MQFALVENVISEPSPGLSGSCRGCGTPTVAKCGQHNIWHWAHKSRVNCDPWWETETEWHRNWKNRFPRQWQECIHFDQETGEKHIADVKTDRGLVIEFQHSVMAPEELRSREQFYKSMVWIVDGCRGGLDLANFRLDRGGQIQDNPVAHSLHWYGSSKLFDNWI
jgi:competence protein CoiA